jgi:small subunit ribosomal protein S17
MTEKTVAARAAKSLRGVVSRCSSQQTVKVDVLTLKSHPKYRKVLKLTTTVTVHDENNSAKVGDAVLISPCKPYSKTKSWKISQIFSTEAV